MASISLCSFDTGFCRWNNYLLSCYVIAFITGRGNCLCVYSCCCFPQIIVVLFARNKLHAAVSVLLLVIFFHIITFYQFSSKEPGVVSLPIVAVGLLVCMFLPLILLSLAGAKAIARRLIFLALGLLFLIALNELSKLGLDVTAPKLQG